jgi:hypothetical protein
MGHSGPLRSAREQPVPPNFLKKISQPGHERTYSWSGVVRDDPVRANVNCTGPTQPRPSMGQAYGQVQQMSPRPGPAAPCE